MKANPYDIASGRASFYNFLIAGFEVLPDLELLLRIRNGQFQRFLVGWRDLGDGSFRSGLDLISSYQSTILQRPDDETVTELSVDRTRILRGTGHADMKPPYEGLYKRGAGFGDSVLGLKRFYRKAGLLPDETVSDSADYLFVELDFMKQLCLREQTLLREEKDEETITQTIALEEEFLRLHLGDWVGEFCSAVEKHASTDFYRGLALILDAHLRTDKKWLRSLVRRRMQVGT
ncbi:MAG TPA: molecular chaperone TorD family protein [Syntrophorhabdales bacterium]|nr:molecular chaperone TorD family protein [Syntrophorhabdales bacterium]